MPPAGAERTARAGARTASGRAARSLSRVGVIDIGSNSVRLVVFETKDGTPQHFFNEKALCGLGEGLERSGRLSPEGCRRSMQVLDRFRLLCKSLDVGKVLAVATAAVREASDGKAFVDEVERRTRLRVRTTGGEEEARHAANGVLLGMPDACGLAADLGGASLEIAEIAHGRVGRCASLPVGPLRFPESPASGRRARAAVDDKLASCSFLRQNDQSLHLVGGSWRALARIHMARTEYPPRVVQGFTLPRDEAGELARWAASQTAETLAGYQCASSSRLRVIPYGGLVLDRLLSHSRAQRIILSAFGLREDVLYESLSDDLRKQDPLIAACSAFERRRARCPGYGRELFDWVQPLCQGRDAAAPRLVLAACLCNDVEWREHPDYRAEIAFDAMMRVEFLGLTHPDRLFLALALLYRHKGASRIAARLDASGLLSASRIREAETLGRAMRVAGHVAASAKGALPHCPLRPQGATLSMAVPRHLAALVGEAAERELHALARLLGKQARISTPEAA